MSSAGDFHARYSAARTNDPDAREWLAEHFHAELLPFVERRSGPAVRQRHDPEDLAQEAMMTFLERVPSFPAELTERDVRARLFQIAKWRIADLFRNPRREVREASMSALEPVTPEPSRGPVTRDDDRRHLRELVHRLSDTDAEVLELCVLQGHGVAQTAETLGLAEETVRKRLERARARLDELATSWRDEESGSR